MDNDAFNAVAGDLAQAENRMEFLLYQLGKIQEHASITLQQVSRTNSAFGRYVAGVLEEIESLALAAQSDNWEEHAKVAYANDDSRQARMTVEGEIPF